MAGFGFVAQPLTVAVKTSPEVVFTEITSTLLQQFGRTAIACCQPLGGGVFHVTFLTTASYQKATAEGLRIRNEVLEAAPVSGVPITVTIRNAPFALPADVITTHLRAYGQVLHHSFECPDPEHSVTNGNRRIRMIMNQPIPNFLRIGAYQVMVVYPGMQRVCRRCSGEGHFARECTAVFCRECRKWMTQLGCAHLRATEHAVDKEASVGAGKEQGTFSERSADEGMDTSVDPAGLWNEVFRPPAEMQSELSKSAQQTTGEELQDDSKSTSAKKSFAEVVEGDLLHTALSQGLRITDTAPKRRTQSTTVGTTKQALIQDEGMKVLPPPPVSPSPPRPQVMVALSLQRTAEGGKTTLSDDQLKRSLSISSLDSLPMVSACSEGSMTDVSVAGKTDVTKRKKKKSVKVSAST